MKKMILATMIAVMGFSSFGHAASDLFEFKMVYRETAEEYGIKADSSDSAVARLNVIIQYNQVIPSYAKKQLAEIMKGLQEIDQSTEGRMCITLGMELGAGKCRVVRTTYKNYIRQMDRVVLETL
ncbi:hypothetical protein [Bdellovibrio sp. HCB-162]|uniref:hypothetical protein n=1 Tax=Bdellovibrio sp. HCB-162 TaxID=3394234 RepID=UPI0039BC5ABA